MTRKTPITAVPAPVPLSEQSPYWAAPGYWDRRHAAKLAEIAAGPKEYDCVFVGDSIAHNWEGWSDPADAAMMPDFLHPLEEGYRIWADALRPFLHP